MYYIAPVIVAWIFLIINAVAGEPPFEPRFQELLQKLDCDAKLTAVTVRDPNENLIRADHNTLCINTKTKRAVLVFNAESMLGNRHVPSTTSAPAIALRLFTQTGEKRLSALSAQGVQGKMRHS